MHARRNIAATLKRAKENSGKSLDEFVESFDLQRTSLLKYMKMDQDEDRANPTILSLELLAEGLDMTVAQLVSDPDSLDQVPLGCANCIKMPVHCLHPKLRYQAELMLNLFTSLSQSLYDLDRQSKNMR